MGRFSTVVSAHPFAPPAGEAQSLEIWLEPARIWDSGTLLAYSTPEVPLRFMVLQSQVDLVLQTDPLRALLRQQRSRHVVKNVFRRPQPRFLSITCGTGGTKVYVDGSAVQTFPDARPSTNLFGGDLVVGDAPWQGDSWAGRLYGLAIYDRELSATQVLRHFTTWTRTGRPETDVADGVTALYLFNEGHGRSVQNRAGPGPALVIPDRYRVVHQTLFEPFWEEFSWTRSYWGAALKNIVGFVPLGFCLYPYLQAIRRFKRAMMFTVLLGTLVSLTIESVQYFLPTRESGTTDIFTNTLGTLLGGVAYVAARPTLAALLPWPVFDFTRGPHQSEEKLVGKAL